MAEKAAHHTATIVSHPSIFEVIAQDYLSSTSYPALKKVTNVRNFIKKNEKTGYTFYYFCLFSTLLIKIPNS